MSQETALMIAGYGKF